MQQTPHTNNYTHATSIQKVTANNQTYWYLLDSYNSHPLALGTQVSWCQLHGNIITLQKDFIWNHIPTDSILGLADPAIEHPHLTQPHAEKQQPRPQSQLPKHIPKSQLPRPQNSSPSLHSLRLITMNVKGLYKSKQDVADLLAYHDQMSFHSPKQG